MFVRGMDSSHEWLGIGPYHRSFFVACVAASTVAVTSSTRKLGALKVEDMQQHGFENVNTEIDAMRACTKACIAKFLLWAATYISHESMNAPRTKVPYSMSWPYILSHRRGVRTPTGEDCMDRFAVSSTVFHISWRAHSAAVSSVSWIDSPPSLLSASADGLARIWTPNGENLLGEVGGDWMYRRTIRESFARDNALVRSNKQRAFCMSLADAQYALPTSKAKNAKIHDAVSLQNPSSHTKTEAPTYAPASPKLPDV